MRIVIVESPFAGDVTRNLRYLRACLRDCLKRGEAPYASHAIYTQPGVLDDGNAAERTHGIEAGFEFRQHAAATIVYTDLGESKGMGYGIAAAKNQIIRGSQHALEYRTLGDGWEQRARECEDSFKTPWPQGEHSYDEAMALLGAFCDVVDFQISDARYTRKDFLHEALRRCVEKLTSC